MGRFELGVGGHMSVGVQREACGVMSQHGGHGFHVHAVLECHGGECVSEVMEAYPWQSRPFQNPLEHAKHLDFLKQQVREMDRKIAEIMETLDTPITTITGIGPTLGAYILSEIGDISRFSSAAKLAAYAGIDLTMRQSGEYNGVRNRMSKRGSPYLRHAIWLAASSTVLHDPALKLYFQKKRDEGKPYMASVGHACRKMVSIIYAVMRDNKAYTPCIPNEISA